MKAGQTDASDRNAAGPPSGSRRSLKKTLLLWFLATSLIPLTAVSAISYIRAKDSLRAASYESLTAKAEEKAAFIDDWFHYRFIDLELQATSTSNARFLGELRDAFQTSGTDIGSFVKSFRWNMIAEEHAGDLRSFRRMYDYYDVLLIDTEGNILFTAALQEDFGTNLFHGPYAKTHLSAACRTALETGRPTFSDLNYYAPSGGLAAGFLTSVIVDEAGEKLGVFAIQIRSDAIESAMMQKVGQGDKGAAYLIGFSPKRGVTLRSTL